MNEQGSEMMSFAPLIQGTILAARMKGSTWVSIIGELIDNSFDVNANRIDITVEGRTLSVSDNGNGCDDLEKMLTLGRHSRTPTTRLGRYGVGFKDAAWWVGGPTWISTVSDRQVRHSILNWDAMTTWHAPRPLVSSAQAGEVGTTIKFTEMSRDRRFPDGQRLVDMLEEIAFIYTPAIKQGRQIWFRKRGDREAKLLKRFELPSMTDVIDTTIKVDGRTARVHVGVVPDGVDNPRPGISYTHEWRVIIPACALGCNGHDSSRIAGWVVLDDGWQLSRNKDDVSARKEELGEAVFDAIKGIVIKAASHSVDIKSALLEKNLTESFRGAVSDGVGVGRTRGPNVNKSGTVKPKGTGQKRPGTASSRQVGRMTVRFGKCNRGAIGHVDLDGGQIILADNHPHIAALRRDHNEAALWMTAVFLFVTRDKTSPTPLLSIFRDGSEALEIENVVGRLAADQYRAAAPLALVAP